MRYRIHLIEEETPGGGTHWLAVHPDLVGCHGLGRTQEEALAELQQARDTWLRVAREQDGKIPPEDEFESISVRYLYRPGYEEGEAGKQIGGREVRLPEPETV